VSVAALDAALGVDGAPVDADCDGAGSVAAGAVDAAVVEAVLGAADGSLVEVVLGAEDASLVELVLGAIAASLAELVSLSVVFEATLEELDALREVFALAVVEPRASFGARDLLGAAAGAGDSMAALVLALSLPLSANVVAGASGALVSATVV